MTTIFNRVKENLFHRADQKASSDYIDIGAITDYMYIIVIVYIQWYFFECC